MGCFIRACMRRPDRPDGEHPDLTSDDVVRNSGLSHRLGLFRHGYDEARHGNVTDGRAEIAGGPLRGESTWCGGSPRDGPARQVRGALTAAKQDLAYHTTPDSAVRTGRRGGRDHFRPSRAYVYSARLPNEDARNVMTDRARLRQLDLAIRSG